MEPHQTYRISNKLFQVRYQKYIDILLGIDYPQFHTSVKEVKKKNGDPVAKHTPLG